MKNIAVIAIALSIVLVAGCVSGAQNQQPASSAPPSPQQNQSQNQPASPQFSPLSATSQLNIKILIEKLDSDYKVTDIQSNNDLTTTTVTVEFTIRDGDITKIFELMRSQSETGNYHVKVIKTMGSSSPKDYMTCDYGDDIDAIDSLIAVKWLNWKNVLETSTC